MGFINLKKFIQMKYNLNYFMRNLFLVFEVWAAYIKFCQIIKLMRIKHDKMIII